MSIAGLTRYGRSWRLGLLALYLLATLAAAMLPEPRVAHASSPDAGHGMSMSMDAAQAADALSHCDHAAAQADDGCDPGAPNAHHDRSGDVCGAGMLCAVAHLWLPDRFGVRFAAVAPVRYPPAAPAFPRGLERMPDLRPPARSA